MGLRLRGTTMETCLIRCSSTTSNTTPVHLVLKAWHQSEAIATSKKTKTNLKSQSDSQTTCMSQVQGLEVLLEKQDQATKQVKGETEEATDSRTSNQAVVQLTGTITEDRTETTVKEDQTKRFKMQVEVVKTMVILKTTTTPHSNPLTLTTEADLLEPPTVADSKPTSSNSSSSLSRFKTTGKGLPISRQQPSNSHSTSFHHRASLHLSWTSQ